MAPRPCKLKEQAVAECAAKAAASQQKANQRLDQITGLASLEQCMIDESQQGITQAAWPLALQIQKLAGNNSVNAPSLMQGDASLPGKKCQCSD